jgi:hypothetical protein
MKPEPRDALGKAVRAEWVKWAQEQEDPKPSWLVEWEWLSERDKEVDRRIAEAVVHKLALMIVPPMIGALLTEEQIRILLSEALP